MSAVIQIAASFVVIPLLDQLYEFYWRTFWPVDPDVQRMFLGAQGMMIVAALITAAGVLIAMSSGNPGVLQATAIFTAVCNVLDFLFVYLVLDVWHDRPIGYVVDGSLLVLGFFAAVTAAVSLVVMFFSAAKA